MKIEEAAAKYALNNECKGSWNDIVLSCFKVASNWQAEQNKSEAIAFAEWLPSHAQPRSINRNWVLNADNKEYTTEQLFEMFKNEQV